MKCSAILGGNPPLRPFGIGKISLYSLITLLMYGYLEIYDVSLQE